MVRRVSRTFFSSFPGPAVQEQKNYSRIMVVEVSGSDDSTLSSERRIRQYRKRSRNLAR